MAHDNRWSRLNKNQDCQSCFKFDQMQTLSKIPIKLFPLMKLFYQARKTF